MKSKILTNNEGTLEEIKQKIFAYDLSIIIERLVLIEGWSLKDAKTICDQYRRFLFLKAKYGKDFDLPPSRDIDEAWHSHILYTNDYIDFCKEVFGFYLHHFPQHGRDEKTTTEELRRSFTEETQKFYFKEFGSYIYDVSSTPFITEILRVFNKYFIGTKIKIARLER